MDDLKEYFKTLRHEFAKGSLSEEDVAKTPFLQFEKWMKEAVDAQVNEANAMALTTVSAEHRPSTRIVLLRNFDENGFVFYTNYKGRKGKDIEENNNAALLFFWPELERQVRIEGTLIKHSAEESDRYFKSRPRESKLGAWTSEQSKVIANRKVLDDAFEALSKKYPGNDIPRPDYWGGYVLSPVSIEFWQGRPGRLHDRILYTKEENNWKIERLAP